MNLFVINVHAQIDENANKEVSPKVINEYSLIFSFGGESKLALFLPKFEYLRIHQLKPVNLYYGGSFGIHSAFVTGYGAISAVGGLEYKRLDFSSSISHLRILKARIDENDSIGPFSQNLINLKLGIRVKEIRFRIGTSMVLNENTTIGEERSGLLDFGKIGNRIFLIEIQTILKRN